MLTLRDYQEKAVCSIIDYLKRFKGNPVLDACVGSGKSLMIAETVKRIHIIDPNARILMLTHVKELIEQNYEKLKNQYPMSDAGIYSASVGRRDYKNKIIYAGIQSVHSRANQIGAVNVILVDEAHLISPSAYTMYRKFIKKMKAKNPKLRVVGFTGTAYRSKEGLITEGENALFDDVCYSVTLADLIDLGYLVPLISKSSEYQADLKNVHVRCGEYINKEVESAMSPLTEKAIDEVEKWASDRRCGLFFCTGVEHAKKVRDALRLRGYTAETITGSTAKKERVKILEDFKSGKIRYLTNDSVLTTGTDIPMLDLIVMLRATKSPVLYAQILGRGVRCLGKDFQESKKNGKENCVVLDFGGNVKRFGPVDKIKFKPKKEKGESGITIIPTKICQFCREPSPVNATHCKSCGSKFPMVDRGINHDAKAYDGAILSRDIKPKLADVNNMKAFIHKKNGKKSVRIHYMKGLTLALREWIPVGYEGSAGKMAIKKWERLFGEAPPETAEEAVDYVNKRETHISGVWYKKNGKYKEVIGYEY